MSSCKKLAVALPTAACAIAVLAIGLWIGPAQAQEKREPVVEFTGTGDRVTESFTVGDGWSAEWSSEDERIEIRLKGTDTGIASLVANPVDPGQGRAVYAQDGTYHFEIKAEGPWRISVFDE